MAEPYTGALTRPWNVGERVATPPRRPGERRGDPVNARAPHLFELRGAVAVVLHPGARSRARPASTTVPARRHAGERRPPRMEFRSPRLSRRRFLGFTAAAGAVTALPLPRASAAEGCHPIT